MLFMLLEILDNKMDKGLMKDNKTIRMNSEMNFSNQLTNLLYIKMLLISCIDSFHQLYQDIISALEDVDIKHLDLNMNQIRLLLVVVMMITRLLKIAQLITYGQVNMRENAKNAKNSLEMNMLIKMDKNR